MKGRRETGKEIGKTIEELKREREKNTINIMKKKNEKKMEGGRIY